jgi:hypothetical protein
MITHGRGNGSKSLISIFTTLSAKSLSSKIWCNFIFHSPKPLSLTSPFSQTVDEEVSTLQRDKLKGFEMILELFQFMRRVFERPRNFDAVSVLAEITKLTEAVVKALFPKCENRKMFEERTKALSSNTQLIVGRAME